MHVPGHIGSDVPAVVVGLAERARADKITIYAGAGLSAADPTEIPRGEEVSRRIFAALRPQFTGLDGIDQTNLPKIADAIAGEPGGTDAVRHTAVRVAEFTTAPPSYGHRVLALLILEGAIDVLTTNWDDCIERSGGVERVPAVVNEHDLLNVQGEALLKIHGCATQPSTMLITSADLETPPSWVTDQAGARLGTGVVVFVGIGDIAGYVKQRLSEAIGVVGNPANIRVVSPSIVSKWETSQWSELLPDLAEEKRLGFTADHFAELLASGYVHVILSAHLLSVLALTDLHTHLQTAVIGLEKHDSEQVLEWSRRTSAVPTRGKSTLDSSEMLRALAVVGKHAGDAFRLTRDFVIETPDVALDLVVATGPQTADRMRKAAQRRLNQLRAAGAREPTFIASGGFGWSPATPGLPQDIMGDSSEIDIVDGPEAKAPTIVRAEEEFA